MMMIMANKEDFGDEGIGCSGGGGGGSGINTNAGAFNCPAPLSTPSLFSLNNPTTPQPI